MNQVNRAHPGTSQDGAAVAATLLDFFAFPGRYATVMREPRILFEGATQVLTLAAGRTPEGWPDELAIDENLRQAARFFVRAVMLRPTADHYTLMGVSPGFQAGTLRDHYRLLMRMTHPDFATESEAWPSDAATRINQANDVLSSVVRRAEYDQSMTPPPQAASVSQPRSVPAPPSRTMSVPVEPRLQRRHWPVAAGVAGALALLVIWQWPSDNSRDSLIKLSDESPVGAVQSKKAVPMSAEAPAAAGRGVTRDPGVHARSEPPLPALAAASNGWASSKLALPSNAGEAPAKERVSVTVRDDRSPLATVKSSVPGPVAGAVSSSTDASPHSQKLAAPIPAAVAVTAATPVPPNALRPPASLSSPVVAATALPVPSVPVPPEPSVGATGATKPEILRMADVQPMLGQLLSAFASGRGDQISRLVDRSAKQGDGGARFVELYNRTVSGARGVRVGAVQFADRGVGEQLAVDGVVLLQIMDDGARPQTRELVVRAWFSSRDGQPVLTQLTTGESAR